MVSTLNKAWHERHKMPRNATLETRIGWHLAHAKHVLLTVTLLATGACRDELQMYNSLGPRYEARDWLATTTNPFPFASNRFQSKEAAAAFIDSLYTFGAETVYVLNVQQDSAWLAREGGPYADALLLRLPDDVLARACLFQVNAREAWHEGFDPERDRNQRYLYFWWD